MRKTTKYSALSASHTFFSGGVRDSSFLGRQVSQPLSRNRLKQNVAMKEFVLLRTLSELRIGPQLMDGLSAGRSPPRR